MNIYSPRNERETVITFNPNTGKAHIWTNEEPMINKLDKMVEKFPETYQCTQVWKVAGMPDTIGNKEYEVDRKRISFTSPREGNNNLQFVRKSSTATEENEANED